MGGHGVLYKDATFSNGETVSKLTLVIYDGSSIYRMARWGLNTYLYAPKDDDKHRAYWRELYSLEEAGANFEYN